MTGLVQPIHIVVVLVVLAVVLGPSGLRGVGRAVGQSWRALLAGFHEGAQDTVARPALPARPCARCGVWSGEVANYCTRCGAPLP